MRSGKNLILSIALIFAISSPLFSQTENPSLLQQFDEVMENSESFKQYKVIPKTTMSNLFKQVNDSINKTKSEVRGLKSEISEQAVEISSLNSQLVTVTDDLTASNETNGSINFLGIDFKKPVYNIIVWSLILALVVTVGFVYMLFNRSNSITRTTQNDLKELNREFDEHKTKSHEKQVKLKRDLQTAMNTLHEKGIKV